ncbi:MAG: Fic family protein [Candidatus Izemoplasma sp.]|nr:Fic family protein [Candidatus Izemoplasma sp.]
MAYKPPYEITSKMIDYISKIMKLIGQLTSSSGLDNKPRLRRTNRIHSVYSSLAIENNKLTKNQVRDVLNGKIVIGPKRDILEAKNAIRCYDDILTINPYESKDLLKYHGIMMESLIDDAGSYRLKQEGVFDGDKVIFIAPPHDRVPELISNLYDYLNNIKENILIKSSVFHYEFEFIHPFSDGNGRMGRLFQTCLLASEEEIFAYLPVESIIKERQQEYYDAIAICHKQGNSNVFIEFMLDAILETITRTINQSNLESIGYSIQVKKLLSVMDMEIPYTALELMELCGLKSRASFKNNYIDPALESGLIQMTIPDKPKSRNQRYIKTVNY